MNSNQTQKTPQMKTESTSKLTYLILIVMLVNSVPAEDREEKVFDLNPFEVNTTQDSGYLASNSNSAFRVNLPIKEIPLAIDVITRDFIDDLKPVNLEETMRYSVSFANANHDSMMAEGGNFRIRGLDASWPKRNGLRRYYVTEMTNVARVDLIKGAVSAIYGQAEPGGIVNYITKKPMPEPFFSLEASIGSWEFFRLQAAATGPLNKQGTLLYRIDSSYLDRKGYRDYDEEQREFVAPVLQFTPNRNIKITLDAEYTKRDWGPVAPNMIYNREQYEAFLALSPEEQRFKLLGVGAQRPNGTFDNTRPLEVVTIDGQFGPSLTSIVPDHIVPYEENVRGPDSRYESEAIVYTVEYLHELNDVFSLRVAGSYTDVTRGGIQGGNNMFLNAANGFSSTIRNETGNQVRFVQADFLTQLETGMGTHRLTLSADFTNDIFDSAETPFSNRGQLQQQYWYRPDIPGLWVESWALQGGGRTVRINPDYRLREDIPEGTELQYINDKDYLGASVAYSLTTLEERLHLLLGFRYDEYEEKNENFGSSAITVNTNEMDVETLMAGFNYALTDTWNLYANYSESFVPTGSAFRFLDENGEVQTRPGEPELGEGYEIGLKWESPERRFSGSLTWFDLTKTNVTQPRNVNDGNGNFVVISQLVDGQTSNGVEFNLTWTPSSQWQTVFGYAYIDARQQDVSFASFIPEVRAFAEAVRGVPENQMSLWTRYRFSPGSEGWTVGMGLNYFDERTGAFEAERDRILLDPYTRIDALVRYVHLFGDRRFSIDVNVENLLDETYFTVGPYIGDPINFRVTLRYAF